ncbi:methionyl-tRNA formyltransferase [Mucisphaera calidilacus]|uniref:Methionyl-tRNA formyltransferase n=1 Tax=Mucisphaera calidilacus TaxID=2527982 RepID=A0A518BWM1_9BACT|nr:methionyl-tRNA formyltransferase [Mucisphaera calidilacus]QDU71375.1 Methionyl-tRNA formyltransferase [Mucisphaera calidilacus]
MRVVFCGSGSFGVPTLTWLAERHELVGVVTQPDKPAGRKREMTPTPVGAWADDRGLEVLRSEDINSEAELERLRGWGAEAGVVIAFGQKLSPEAIGAMGRLAVNLHASLLPKYRGAAPINWAMIEGELRTGVSVIGLAQRMDAGEVYGQASLAIDPRETAGELHDRLSLLGPEAVGGVLEQLAGDRLEPIEQEDALATKAPKFAKSDGTVSFDQACDRVRCRVHGLTPWPGCTVRWVDAAGEEKGVLKLLRVAAVPDLSCTIGLESVEAMPASGTLLAPSVENRMQDDLIATPDGAVRLLEVQAPGRKAMSFAQFQQGQGLVVGDRLEAMVD